MFLRVLLLVVMGLVALRAIGRFMGGMAQGARSDAPRPGGPRQGEVPVKMAKDPVCGTFVVPGKALSATADGTTLWFCSDRCRDEFARRS